MNSKDLFKVNSFKDTAKQIIELEGEKSKLYNQREDIKCQIINILPFYFGVFVVITIMFVLGLSFIRFFFKNVDNSILVYNSFYLFMFFVAFVNFNFIRSCDIKCNQELKLLYKKYNNGIRNCDLRITKLYNSSNKIIPKKYVNMYDKIYERMLKNPNKSVKRIIFELVKE